MKQKKPFYIEIFGGYIGQEKGIVRGRIYRKQPLYTKGSLIENLKTNYYLFRNYRIDEQEIEIIAGDETAIITTNKHGYFEYETGTKTPQTILIKFQGKTYKTTLLKATKKTRQIIISDIDDTILKTGPGALRAVFTTLLTTINKRRIIGESEKVYNSLAKDSLCFYLSNSSWELHTMLQTLLFQKHNFPKGLLLLRKLPNGKLRKSGREHKEQELKKLLEDFPNYPAIVIGDDNQRDPELYLELKENYPKRIKKIFIRKTGTRKPAALKKLEELGIIIIDKHEQILEALDK